MVTFPNASCYVFEAEVPGNTKFADATKVHLPELKTKGSGIDNRLTQLCDMIMQ